MDDDLAAGCIGIFLALAGIAALIMGAMALSWHGDHVDCLRLHEQTHYETHMTGTMFGGECYIGIDGKWIPASRYRMMDTGN